MAQDGGKPKFPSPLPNPLNPASSRKGTDSIELELDPPVAVEEITPVDTPAPEGDFEREEPTTPDIWASKPKPVRTPRKPALALAVAPPSISAPLAPQPPPVARPAVRMPEMGALDPFMKDPTVTEIMVNDVRGVMLERAGKLVYSGFAYPGIDDLNRLVRAILDVTGRILSVDQPFVDVMLPDGSRVNIVGPPLTISGPCLTIRKFPARHLTIDDLMASEMLDRRIAYFLNVCVVGRLNILVSGGTGSGKTTVLNVLSSFIPKGERIVTIEDTPELAVSHFNSVRLQTKPQSPTHPAIAARELVANSLRMRPDRIIVGECRRGEALDMLQAMNTGHSGSMTTLHANTPRDALARLETLVLMAGVELPLQAVRRQTASAIDLIIQVRRFRGGKRRVVAVSELTGMEQDTYTLQDLFVFEQDARAVGQAAGDRGIFKATGLAPSFVDRLRDQGIEFPSGFFG